MPSARDTVASPLPLGAQPESSPSSPASSLLRMQGIVKRFGTNVALNSVDFDVRAGEIHALLGENGAGKSTLMHVLSGLTRADSGTILLQNQQVRVASPRSARALGIAMVHQHFTLVPAFTVAENLALDNETKSSQPGHYSATQQAQQALERAEKLGWKLDPSARIADLSVGTQQRVEIIKALATNAQILIFDEPTAVLSGEEVEELFEVLRRLRSEGKVVILIAHKLAEILAVADRVTVLRRGNRVGTCLVAETDARRLAEWMVSAEAGVRYRVSGVEEEETKNSPFPVGASHVMPVTNIVEASHVMPVTNVVGASHVMPVGKGVGGLGATHLHILGDRKEQAIRDISLTIGRGEIVGIGGVDGNGQTEFAEALVGLRPLHSGTLTWEGNRFQPGTSPTTGYIPQDRRRAGLAITMSVEENLLWAAVQSSEFRRGPFLQRKALHRLAQELIEKFDIRTTDPNLPVSSLSGGNQQKIVVARALYSQPEWIVAVNPTRGLDIGATRFVHEQLRLARERGAAILLISTDLDELALLADRTSILSGGKLTEYTPQGNDAAQLGLLLGGVGETP